jgi:hypothetical protein
VSAGGASAPRSQLPVLCGTVLVSEVLCLYFAGLTGFGLRPELMGFGAFIAVLSGIAVLLIAAAATLPRRRGQNRPGILLGWIGQALLLAMGIVQPAMVVVAVVFGTMWAVGVYWGRRIDREKTARGE